MLVRIAAIVMILGMILVPGEAPRAQGYGDAVDCTSRGYAYTRCEVPWRDARLVRQLSDTQCVRGRTWGIDRNGLWVDRGCSGRFVETGGGGGGGPWRPGPGWDNRFEVSCGSPQYRYYFCQVDVGGGGRVRIDRQTSDAACVEGRTWGWNRGGIWVDQGCGGVFSVDRRWR